MRRADPVKVQHAPELLQQGASRQEAADLAGLKPSTLARYARRKRAVAAPVPSPVAETTTADPWPHLGPDDLPARPRTRGGCAGGLRPCPWVSCRYHLLGLADAQRTWGKTEIHIGDPDAVADIALDLPQTCALDVADAGRLDLESIGKLLRLTRERVRQIEEKATAKMRRAVSLAEHAAGEEEVHAPTPRSTAARRTAVLDLHEEGLLQAQIAERVGINPSEVSRMLRAEGIKQTRKGPPPNPNRDAALALIEQGLGNTEIGRRLGVKPGTVSAWRAKYGAKYGATPAAAELPDLLRVVGKRGARGPAPSPKRDEALALMAQGLRDAEIAARLGVRKGVVASWRRRARALLRGK